MSTAYVENVVKPPRIPVPRNGRTSRRSGRRSTTSTISTPIRKQPATLVSRVAHGNAPAGVGERLGDAPAGQRARARRRRRPRRGRRSRGSAAAGTSASRGDVGVDREARERVLVDARCSWTGSSGSVRACEAPTGQVGTVGGRCRGSHPARSGCRRAPPPRAARYRTSASRASDDGRDGPGPHGRQSAGGSSPARPSTASRSRSAWPVWRPYSSSRSNRRRRRLAWLPSSA